MRFPFEQCIAQDINGFVQIIIDDYYLGTMMLEDLRR